jgi:exoribonuclease-2
MDDQAAEVLARIAEEAMREKGFEPHPPPPAVAEAEAHREPKADGIADLTGLPWTSIDNVESQDLDQVEVAERVDGAIRVLVGIADVDVLVRAGSAIDAFAGGNTTSVYTGVRTFPMLPERLSYDLTSLHAGRTRHAIVIETRVEKDGSVSASKVYPGVVRNRAKLDYPAVSAWLDGKGPPPAPIAADKELREQVELHDEAAVRLQDGRKREGALDVETSQLRAVRDDAGKIIGFEPHKQDRAGNIVEELMIASNRAVARALDDAGLPSIRRVVKAPERWAKIVAYAGERGHELPPAPDNKKLARFVDAMRRERAAEFAEISLALVKMMGRGEYVGRAPGEPEIGHFGLATPIYTHSTAPNRRYVDLVIHRLLKAVGKGRSPYTIADLREIAERCSKMEAAAEKVERRVQKSAAAMLLVARVGEVFDGVVTGASDKGTFVRVMDPPCEGKIVRGERGLAVGQKVKVKLLEADVEKGYIDFVTA